MANVDFYENQLKGLLTDPNSFSGSPGFKFALDQGLGAVNRSNSRMRGSGNALAALTKYGSGLATQDYGATVDRLGRLTGQEQQFALGEGQNSNNATNIANQFTLGTQQNENTANANNQQYGLGMYKAGNEFALGSEQNANGAQKNWWDYQLGQQQNNNTAANNENNFNLGVGRNGVDWMNAGTSRGNAESNDYFKWLDYMKTQGGGAGAGY